MRLSEEDLAAIISNNPSIRIHELSHKTSSCPLPGSTPVKNKRLSKYGNRKVFVFEDDFADTTDSLVGHGGIVESFDSMKEYRRCMELRQLERMGQIQDLKRQVSIIILESFMYNGKRIQGITYRADFMYRVPDDPHPVVEDIKGIDKHTGKPKVTADFRLKWKLLKKKYPDWNFVIV